MILAYITNTPCIALDNNHKIGSIYKTWLKEQSLIFMSDDIQTIEKYGKNTQKANSVVTILTINICLD